MLSTASFLFVYAMNRNNMSVFLISFLDMIKKKDLVDPVYHVLVLSALEPAAIYRYGYNDTP